MPVDPTKTVEPNLDSFVLRFVWAAPEASGVSSHGPGAAPSSAWHGVIRHVQSNRERAFSRWADAVAFIGEYVDVQNTGAGEQGDE